MGLVYGIILLAILACIIIGCARLINSFATRAKR